MAIPVDVRSDIIRQLSLAVVSLLAVAVVGACGYHLLGAGRWAWSECFYMTVITLSTVGFGELLPGMDDVVGARAWTMSLILFGSGSLVFFVSTLTALVVDSDITGAWRRRRMQRRIDAVSEHIIVVGAGATGIHVVRELVAAEAVFVVIDSDEARLQAVTAQLGPDVLCVHGDATIDGVLEQAGIMRARALATTLREDKDNVFVSITARALNPRLRIAAKLTEDSAATKLRRAGADAVVSPSSIGGVQLASELVRPSVVQFLEGLRSQNLRVEEIEVPAGSPLIGARLRETAIRHHTQVLVMAVRDPDGSYTYNPGPEFVIVAGHTLVVLCRSEDLAALRRGIADGSIGRITA
jgi:voltage-gated potassium channel